MTSPFIRDLRATFRAPATYISAGGAIWLSLAGLIAARLDAPLSIVALLLSMSLAWMVGAPVGQGIALITRRTLDLRREASYAAFGGVLGVLATAAIFLGMSPLAATEFFAHGSEIGFLAIQVLLIGVILAVALRPAGRFGMRY